MSDGNGFEPPEVPPSDANRVPTADEWRQYRSWCADTRPDLSANPDVQSAAALFRRTLTERVQDIAMATPAADESQRCWRVYLHFEADPGNAYLYRIGSWDEASEALSSLCRMHPNAKVLGLMSPLDRVNPS